jgi:integrase
LLDFLLNHYILERPLSPKAIECGYSTAIRSFERFLKRPAKLSDLTAPQVNSFIAALDGTRAPHTVHDHRRTLLMLWRFAFEVGVLAELPRRVRKVKLPRLKVEGWDTEQVGRLLATADTLAGSFKRTGIERRLWWQAFILAAWYTGLRLSDVLAIEFRQIASLDDGSGRLTVIMEKTGDAIHRAFPPDAMAAIRACMASGSQRELCVPLWVCQRYFHREAKLLIHAAGLCGSLKYLRRGSASEAERLRPGAGRQHLGHRTAGLFETNYRVDRITQQEITLPPAPDFTPTLRLEHKPTANGGAQ